jgi:N-acetylmuramoyl-L-alanine amidase
MNVRFSQHFKRMKPHILVWIAIIFISMASGFPENPPAIDNKVRTVVIDAGHGGKDPGAVGSIIKEKDVVLNIALKLGKYIEDNFDDVKVVYTRKTDVFIEVRERPEIANRNNADLFISIHANALSKSKAYGTETFVMGINKDARNFEVAKRENSVITLEEDYETKYDNFDPNSIDSYIIFSVVQKTYQTHSLAFAAMVEEEFKTRAKRYSRGVKQEGFWVLYNTAMPSVLVETGFLTNSAEEKFLGSENGQDLIASAIFRAFRRYKEAIEKNSNFESIIKTEEKELSQTNADPVKKVFVNTAEKDKLYFKVQVVVSRNQLKPDDPFFKSYKNVEEFKSGSWYKYAVGFTDSYKEIINYCSEVKKDFPDAFVIAVKNQEIIKLKDALEEINQ